jgi:hypothetical protein
MMRLAYERNLWSILITSHTVAVIRLGHWTGCVYAWNWWSLRLQSLAEIFGLPPQVGLELYPTH